MRQKKAFKQPPSKGDTPLAVARQAARILYEDAGMVDERSVFPARGIQELRDSGLMGLLVPERYGGMGESYSIMSQVARVLAAECLSTAMIWAMHSQQVSLLVDHAPEALREVTLSRIAREGMLVASVTSETGKGGHLLTADTPLIDDGDCVILKRQAPVVTGGLHADAYLVTMRASEHSPPSEVVLVYADRDQLEVAKLNDWDALGMRGTESVGISLEGRISRDQLLNEPTGFKRVAVITMIPVGHIAWASCWLGAAWASLRRVVGMFRSNPSASRPYDVRSGLFAERLARIRLQLDIVETYLISTIEEYEKLRQVSPDPYGVLNSQAFQIRIHNVKILASEMLYEAVDRLVELSGLRYGYLRNDVVPLERTLRDLRSASLMFSNERLLIANGKLAMFETGVFDATEAGD